MILDVVIVLLAIIGAWSGFRRGFINCLFDFLGLAITIFLAINFYPDLQVVLINKYHWPEAITAIASFGTIFFVSHSLWNILAAVALKLIPDDIELSQINKFSGLPLGVAYTLFYLSVTAWVFLQYPTPETRGYIEGSKLIKPLSNISEPFLYRAIGVLDMAIKEVGTAHISSPIIGESKKLNIPFKELNKDEAAERQLFEKVNEARKSQGLNTLVFSEELAAIGRKHAEDMWRRQYFSHTNPDGQTPADRVDEANIRYLITGENLALAPNVDLAHKGLMDSPGHRENILHHEFNKVGIGAISAGKSNGIMFVQVFTN